MQQRLKCVINNIYINYNSYQILIRENEIIVKNLPRKMNLNININRRKQINKILINIKKDEAN